METTETLARWIVATKYDEIPAAAIEQAKKSILDYIGTATYGTTTPLGKIILEFTREQGGKLREQATNGGQNPLLAFDHLGQLPVIEPNPVAHGTNIHSYFF